MTSDAPSLRLIGYWVSEDHPEYPDPSDFVDPGWAHQATGTWKLPVNRSPRWVKHEVRRYLDHGVLRAGYRGLSPCRICGEKNGAKELTDGIYTWPEGLAHYVGAHDVGLPEEFVQHVMEKRERIQGLEPDLSWWLAATGSPTAWSQK